MKIAILPNLNKKDAHAYTVKLIKRLIELNSSIVLYSKYKGYFNFDEISFYDDFFELINICDIVIVVGGDGSIIHAAKHAAVAQKPILGINLGRVGFVAGLEPNELDKLSDLVSGNFEIEKRMMLEVSVKASTDDKEQKIFALNDAVISRGALSRIIDLEVTCNDSKISQYRSDGIIISTPTGSTAYSLSAGGPVLEPQMRCILLTPICSHTLFSRSIVFCDKTKLSIAAKEHSDLSEIHLSIDGETSVKLYEDFNVSIRPSDIEVRFINLKGKDFYKILNEKLSERRI